MGLYEAFPNYSYGPIGLYEAFPGYCYGPIGLFLRPIPMGLFL